MALQTLSNRKGFCLGLTMDSNDNVTGAIPQSGVLASPKRTTTWKDLSPPTSVREDTATMAESGNANSKALSAYTNVGGGGDDGGGGQDREADDPNGQQERSEEDAVSTSSSSDDVTVLDHKAQVTDGPVIRMGMGAVVTSRRDTRSQPESLSVKGQGPLSTWKDVSPPKEKRNSLSTSPKETAVANGEGANKPEEEGGGGGVVCVDVEKSRNPIRTNPFHEGAGVEGKNFPHGAKRIKMAVGASTATGGAAVTVAASSNAAVARVEQDAIRTTAATTAVEVECVAAMTTWRDVSPTKPRHEGRRKRPESGYFSNDVGQESREEIDSSLSDSDSGRRDHSSHSSTGGAGAGAGGGEDGGCFHSSDYFYEDEFSVQFDTNLREAVVVGGNERTALLLAAHGAVAGEVEEDEDFEGREEAGEANAMGSGGGGLPRSLDGSYTKFRDSLLLLPPAANDIYVGPYESELSGGSRGTSMEVSSSEREMMCSSDMLNFSTDPLFTPSPPPSDQEQQHHPQHLRQLRGMAPQPQETVSVDSLSQHGPGGEMGDSRSSNLGTVDCCIRKDAYFLSFNNGSQQRSSSDESDISYVSQDGHQGGGSQSDSSHGQDAEDEGSKSGSFHFPENEDDGDGRSPSQPSRSTSPPPAIYHPVRNMLLSRYPGRVCLEALQDYLLSRSSSSKSAGSSRHSCSSHCKLSPLCGTLLSSGDLFMSGGHRRGLKRSSNLTTWKQVNNLKKLGKEQNIHERSNSMPDLTAEDMQHIVRREKTDRATLERGGGRGGVGAAPPPRTIESLADSFHTKRHSAYILELYQRLMSGSTPPSPTTLSRIDGILFPAAPPVAKEEGRKGTAGAGGGCRTCPSCGMDPGRNLPLDLPLPFLHHHHHHHHPVSGRRQDAQCGRSLCSAATSMSPPSVSSGYSPLILWQGQKNFAAQFPPNTADCGVQASMGGLGEGQRGKGGEEESPELSSRSMQTSPGSPGADFLHALQQMQSRGESQDDAQCRSEGPATTEKRATTMKRTKSACECRLVETHADRLKMRMRRTVSLSPSRIGMNSFYTHNSLPDLSFLHGASKRAGTSTSTSKSSSSSSSRRHHHHHHHPHSSSSPSPAASPTTTTSPLPTSSSHTSIFDPVQIPIILTPVLEDGGVGRSSRSQSRSSLSSGCGCSGGTPAVLRRRRRCSSLSGGAETSSGSNFSLSSSSGIEPGSGCVVDARSLCGLAPELEHLLFHPPHLESAFLQLGLSGTRSRSRSSCSNSGSNGGESKANEGGEEEEEEDEDREASSPTTTTTTAANNTAVKNRGPGPIKINRYANETHPCAAAGGRLARGSLQQQRGNNNNNNNTDPASSASKETAVASLPNPDAHRLDALKEEKTPSPEPFASPYRHYPPRDYTDYRCFGCHNSNDGGWGGEDEEDSSSQELDEEKLMMYQRWLQERKPPLKSCLRKRCERDQRARSLSNLNAYHGGEGAMDGVGIGESLDEPAIPEKPPRKPLVNHPHRHSIACDGIMPVLVDEEGFEYATAGARYPAHPCSPPPPPPHRHHPRPQTSGTQCCLHHHHHHHHHLLQHTNTTATTATAGSAAQAPEYAGEKVVLRRKKPAAAPAPSATVPEVPAGVDGASVEDSMRAKRVSFASEVSFHSPSYTPQSSPRRQEGEITAVQMEDDVLTLHVVRRNRGLPHCIDPDKDVNTAANQSKAPAASAEPCAPLAPTPWEQKACTVRGVLQAAEALVQHFAQARDPFDKVRLGNSQETEAVGTLVVTCLCPAIERVVRDGMKTCATGLHIFGKVQLSPWRVTEGSAEIGPYTRAIHDLVKQLKVRPNLVSHRQKFYAFLAGLLNLRLLDFWMGYLSNKDTLISRFYHEDAILCLSRSSLHRYYQDMLLALQPLAVLPFQVDYDVVASHALADSSYMGESDMESNTSPNKPSNQQPTQPLSSSPKIVIAREKSRTAATANRASWAGPTDRQDTSLDFSTTWDWIKNTTLPKARSLMTDIGLMSSTTTSVTSSLTSATPGATAAVPTTSSSSTSPSPCPSTVKVSRASQDFSTATVTSTASPVLRRSRLSQDLAGMAGAMPTNTVKTSRLSQDLASVGIVTSRQNISSVTASSSLPELTRNCPSRKDSEVADKEETESRPSSFPNRKNGQQPALPAVVVDHGAKRKGEVSAARQKAEDILRRKNAGELSPQRRFPKTSPLTTENTEKAECPNKPEAGNDVAGNQSPDAPSQHPGSSPLNVVGASPQKSSPIRILSSPARQQTSSPSRQTGSPIRQTGSPVRQTGSPSRQSGSPSRQSGSPSRQSGSPNRQSGSPSRGPIINPSSPKPIIAGMRGGDATDLISRHISKVALDDFPEDVDGDVGGNASKVTPIQSPIAAAALKLVPKKEEKVYREGKTDYAFEATAQSPEDPGTPASATTTATKASPVTASPTTVSPTATSPTTPTTTTPASTAPQNANTTNQASGRMSRLSGLKKLSPRGPFNIISFFDRLLLPIDKGSSSSSNNTTTTTTTTTTNPAVAVAKAPAPAPVPNEWESSAEQASSVATGTSSSTSSSAPSPSPTPPESLHTSSSTSNTSSPRAKVPKSQAKTSSSSSSSGRGSRIPKRQAEGPVCSRNAGSNPAPPPPPLRKQSIPATSAAATTTTPVKTEKRNIPSNLSRTRAMRPKQAPPQPIPVATTTPTPIPTTTTTTNSATTTITRTNRSETPEVDINANSPEFQPSEEEMFVEHNPIMGHWAGTGSSSDTGQSDGSGDSVSMEEDPSRHASPAKALPAQSAPLRVPAYKYVQTLVSCDPDDPDLLTYDLGERLEVLARVNNDWLFCSKGSQEGLVRMAAIQPVYSQKR